jgi:uncharacterized membrane protein
MESKKEKISAIDGGEVSTGRMEALTDGIFAIAMTLLVLDVRLPGVVVGVNQARDLFVQVAALWPTLLSFAVSFIILAMFWVAHHTEFRYIKKLDNKLIWLNIFYLLFVALLPFSAALLGEFGRNQTAVVIYGVHLIVMVIIQYFIWSHASGNKNLVEENLDPRINTLAKRLAIVATCAYTLAILLSFWNVNITLIIYALVPLPYIFGWIYNLA